MPSEAAPEADAAAGPARTVAARARGVGHRFGGTTALDGVDLAVERGTITALVGANGSGKTTLLRILAGILAPSTGTVEVLGVAEPARGGRATRRELRRRTSYLSQEPALDPEMTGGETLELAAVLHGVPRGERRPRVAELAEAFGVGSWLGRRVGTWSGGLRRRLHLAAGLVQDPDLLLLDEPTAGLDPEGRRLLWADLEARAGDGRAVAIVTHDLEAAERHAGLIAVLDRGRLVAAGGPEELRAAAGNGAATGRGEAVSVDLAEAYRRLTGRDVVDLLPRRGSGWGSRP